MPRPASRQPRSQALATVDRLAAHLSLLAEAKAAIAGVDLNADAVDPQVRDALQRALAFTPATPTKTARRRKRR